MGIRLEADKCASSLQKTGFLMEALLAARIIYYIFKAWQVCHTASGDDISTALSTQGGDWNRKRLRQAKHATRLAYRHESMPYSEGDVDRLTRHCLTHVANAPTEVVAACCLEA